METLYNIIGFVLLVGVVGFIAYKSVPSFKLYVDDLIKKYLG